MGLLDSYFGQSAYGGQGGGLLDLLRMSQMQQEQYQPSAGLSPQQPQSAQPFVGAGRSFDAAQFDPQTYAPNQAQPVAIGNNYQMPRMGSADLYNKEQVDTPPNAQPVEGRLPTQPAQQPAQAQMPMIQSNPGGFSAGLTGFLNNLHTGPIGAIIGGVGSAAGMEDQATKQARLTQNLTANSLLKAGAPADDVMAAIQPGNSKMLEEMFKKYLNREKVRPATDAERKAYGVPEGLPMSIDTTTGKPSYGPAGTNVSTVINGEKEQDKVIGKGYGERFNEIQKAGMTAPTALGTLNLMEKLISDPNFYSGTGGQSATMLKRLAVSAGIAGAETASPNELFQKLSQKSVLDAAGGSLGTGFSNADRDYLNGTVANIDNTPEGNKRIIEIGRQVQQRNIEIAKQAREYAKNHNGRLDAGFEDQIAAYAEKNPLFANAAPQKPQAAKPKTVIQNGHTYTLQSDGSYK